jgi:hypothetical protein
MIFFVDDHQAAHTGINHFQARFRHARAGQDCDGVLDDSAFSRLTRWTIRLDLLPT